MILNKNKNKPRRYTGLPFLHIIFSTLNIPVIFVWIFLFIQTAYSQIEIKNLTEKELLEASTQKEKLGDFREAGRYLNQAATIRWEKKDYAQAIDYYKKSVRLNELVANESGILGIYSNMAMLYADLGDYNNAVIYFKKTLEGRLKGSDKVSIISGYINLATALNMTKKYEEAANNLESALIIALELKDVKQMSSCYGMLAETYEKSGNSEKMLYYFEKFKTFYNYSQSERINKFEKENQDIRLRAELLEANEQIKNLQLQRQSDSLTKTNSKIQAANNRVQTLLQEMDANELAGKYLRQNDEINQLKIREKDHLLDKKNNILVLISAIVSLLIVVLLIVILNSRARKRINKLLKQQKNEIQESKLRIENAYQELETTLFKLKELAEFKESMVGMLVHDLKNPVNAILGLSANHSNDKNLKGVYHAARQLLQMTTNMLDVQKFETSSVELQKSQRNLVFIIKYALDQTFYLAERKNIEIQFDVSPQLLIDTDEDLLSRVVVNLLTNAIKYTPVNGEIYIKAHTTTENKLLLLVGDSGEGIPDDQKDFIFEKYGQINPKNLGVTYSTGLGLTFCKLVIDAHNGTIKVGTSTLGGAEFQITLPNYAISTEKIVTSTKHIAEMRYFTTEENNLLTLIADHLKPFEYYEAADILAIFSKFQNEIDCNPSAIFWKNKVEAAVFSGNEGEYLNLISEKWIRTNTLSAN